MAVLAHCHQILPKVVTGPVYPNTATRHIHPIYRTNGENWQLLLYLVLRMEPGFECQMG